MLTHNDTKENTSFTLSIRKILNNVKNCFWNNNQILQPIPAPYQPVTNTTDLEIGLPTKTTTIVDTKTIALEVKPEDKISAWKIVTSLSTIILAKENRPRVIVASILTAMSSALNFVTPYLLGETIDTLTKNLKDEQGNTGLDPTTLILMLIAANTVSQILPNLRDQVLAPVLANSTKKIIMDISEHQLNKSLDYHSKTPIGDQVYLVQKGFSASGVCTPLLTQVSPTLFEIVMAIAVLSTRYGVGMGLGVAGTAAIYTAFTAKTTKSIINSREIMLKTGNKAWDKITGAFSQYKNIHDFGKTEHELKAIAHATQLAAEAEIVGIIAPLKVNLGQIAIPRLGMIAALLYVNAGIKSTQLSIQDFILLFNYLDKLSTLLPTVGQALNGLFASYPDLKFVFGELAKPSEIIDLYPNTALEIKNGPPSIRFENVTFSYPKKADEPEKPPLFKNLSFNIKGGHTVAFVSQTGGGKSSIFKLLYGYNFPTEGKIYIDEQDISKISLKSLQENIGLIAQKPNLFNDTIRNNILFGAKEPEKISDEKIWELAKLTNLTGFLNSFDEKLNKSAGENGDQLSGGEQQRVGILRGLLKEAPIRLFDEITSALDSLTASKVLDGIEKLTKGKTKLIITHKLAEAQVADTIFVIAGGKVIAEGTHSKLLETCDLYQTLWNEQTNVPSSPRAEDTKREKSPLFKI